MVNVPARGLPDSTEGLVRLAARGDEAAFARIVRLHHADMVRVCFVVTGDVDLAREAVAGAWPAAWRRLGRLRTPDQLRPWLCSIAANEACRRMAGRGHGSAAGVAPGEADEDASSGAAGHAADVGLARELARLTPAERALLAMRCVVGLDGTELDTTGFEAELDTTGFEAGFEQRLNAYAAIAVRPVDVDAVARGVRSELLDARSHLVSVVVSAIVAALVTAVLYVMMTGGHYGAALPTTSPTSPLASVTPVATAEASGVALIDATGRGPGSAASASGARRTPVTSSEPPIPRDGRRNPAIRRWSRSTPRVGLKDRWRSVLG